VSERDEKSDETNGKETGETHPREQKEESRAFRLGPALAVLVPMNLLMIVPGMIWSGAVSTQFAAPAVFIVVMSNALVSFYICYQCDLQEKQELERNESEPDPKR